MTFTWYTDTAPNFAKQKEMATTNDQVFNITIEKDHPIIKLDFADIDAPMDSLKIDAIGIRGQLQESVSPSVATMDQESNRVAEANANRMMQSYFTRYSNGPVTVQIMCRRTTTINGLNVGDWTLIDVDQLPNQATHLRGGNRIMQVVSKTPDGIRINVKLIDGAVNSTMAVPTINSIAANSSYPNNAANVSITTSEDARVILQYALTPIGASQPSSGDAGWTRGDVDVLYSETKLMYIDRLASGADLWVRAHCESIVGNDVKMPSAWVYSSNHSLTQLAAPTSLTITNISYKSAKVNWVPSAQPAKLEVLLASPTGSTLHSVVVLPSGSNNYTLRGLELNPSITNTVGVRYVDVLFGRSDIVTTSFNASGSAQQLPDLGEIIVYFGDVV
jgi:hypothetical protein